ncbi:MAG: heavy-metal-associated domain-containing protein [Gemmatimonadetes bacterium]|nr:heavy-metal-associated domain-containing protein [Gemmatimonadota bacterium]
MASRRNLAAGVVALGVAFGLPGAVQGQQASEEPTTREVLAPSEVLTGASVRLRVDGMVCPFCAYGLEKRLQEIASIDAVLIRISDGLVQIRTKEDQELTDAALEDAVKKSGFSLTGIERLEG